MDWLKQNWFKVGIIAAVVLSTTFVAYSGTAQAVGASGACSYDGGVNCAVGPAYHGNAICNDGTESLSVLYQEPVEYQCQPPVAFGCTTDRDVAYLRERSGGFTILKADLEKLAECEAQAALYQRQMRAYEACLASANAYLPVEPLRTPESTPLPTPTPVRYAPIETARPTIVSTPRPTVKSAPATEATPPQASLSVVPTESVTPSPTPDTEAGGIWQSIVHFFRSLFGGN